METKGPALHKAPLGPTSAEKNKNHLANTHLIAKWLFWKPQELLQCSSSALNIIIKIMAARSICKLKQF